ncbi:MAG: phosphoenolpyruvate carboxylase [Pleurocapsa minor GSE-CHR-MK-17-07R]|jgi:phosphoenolpyruvate carboxylase|nr:phosphoenolpyruvate carboxylase [Pleurocapsa minor GSE-CHR-MK 17-07R]
MKETQSTAEVGAVIPQSEHLRASIRHLGGLLGKVIKEQHGVEAYDLVEDVRARAKARRLQDPNGSGTLLESVENLDIEHLRILTKSFSNYFQLINIAEDQQRIRVLRSREAQGRLDESIETAVRALHDRGMSAEDLRALLTRTRICLVMTAHPSEAKRKEVLVKLQHIARLVRSADQIDLLPREERMIDAAITEEIEELWQTRPTRSSRPSVADEVDFGVHFLTTEIMDRTIDIYEDLIDVLQHVYPDSDWSDLPAILQYASWIGGDRDGNPNVTADVTMETLRTMREAARRIYLEEITLLRNHLTQSVDEIGVSEELVKRAVITHSDESGSDELYGLFLDQVHARLSQDAYLNGAELLEDVLIVQRSLLQNRGEFVANGSMRRLVMKIRLFGLHLAPLDVREDARLHRAAVKELFAAYNICDDFSALPEAEKQALITREIQASRPLFPMEPQFSDVTNRIIATWRMIARAHRKYGRQVIDTVIASMSTAPSDVLIMLMFAREVGVANDVDIVPLFETIDDLKSAPDIVRTIFANEEYAAALKARGNRQQIMLGYSDSNKDGGYIASNWNLFLAQQALSELCLASAISLELFHGRGGSIGRGGGPANRSILSQPPQSLHGRLKITEQGEVIAYRYSNADIARRHLNQVISAVLLAIDGQAAVNPAPDWIEAMQALSLAGQQAYRDMVYETPGFESYWQQATPINELARMPISSRPAKRAKGGFEAVRAIPWIFSWMQSRAIIPSWFGIGSAIEAFIASRPDGLVLLQKMYREWRFFQTLIENAELDLAKADMGIAGLYATLVSDDALRDTIFMQVQAEHARSCEAICKVTGQQRLLERSPVMQVSIERRNPYIDPLNFIQVVLLRRLRPLHPGTKEYEQLVNVILSTINGIAAGMKTTG